MLCPKCGAPHTKPTKVMLADGTWVFGDKFKCGTIAYHDGMVIRDYKCYDIELCACNLKLEKLRAWGATWLTLFTTVDRKGLIGVRSLVKEFDGIMNGKVEADQVTTDLKTELATCKESLQVAEDKLKDLRRLSDDMIYGNFEDGKFISYGITDNEENATRLHDLLADIIVKYYESDDYDEEGG